MGGRAGGGAIGRGLKREGDFGGGACGREGSWGRDLRGGRVGAGPEEPGEEGAWGI